MKAPRDPYGPIRLRQGVPDLIGQYEGVAFKDRDRVRIGGEEVKL